MDSAIPSLHKAFMKEWKRDGRSIHIVKTPRMGCAYVFISILGAVITLGAGLFLLAEGFTDGMSMALVWGGLVLLFGLVFFLGGFGGRKFNFRSFVEITESEIRFRKDEKDPHYRLDIGEVEKIVCLKVMKTTGGGDNARSYPSYQIFLRKRDGAYFWLDSFRSEQHFVDALDMLYEFLGLEVRDKTGFKQDKPATRQYEPFSRPESLSHSKYVHLVRDGIGTHISIRGPRDFLGSLLKVLVFGLFLGVPSAIAYNTFAGADPGSPFAWVMFLFVGPFVLVFISLVLLILLMTLRRFELELANGKLLVHQRFPLGFLNQTTEIAAGMVRAVRVNRLDDGHFSLSIAADKQYQQTVQGSKFAQLLLMLSAFQKPGSQIPEQDKIIINLWEIPGYQKQTAGANHQDLLYLENFLQRELGTRE